MIRRAMRLHAAVLLAAGALVLAACEAKDPAVLELEGETVRRSDFERHLAAVTRGLGPVEPAARRGILEAFIEERALVIEARRRGHLPPGAGPDAEAGAVARLLAEVVHPPQVTDEEVAAYYEAHAAELAVPETVTLRQIVVATLNEARDVRRRLARNPTAFEVIARSQSKGEEAGAGGYMGPFQRGQLPPELEAAAFALPEGGTSEPVPTGLGYHVLRVESRQPARAPSLDEARERIRAHLTSAKRAEAERAFVAEVLARAKVNHEAALRPYPPS
jgi:parvulin-like peptidyl-prolyl cis-trans isomerase-like protein